jgi:hypothetical protein
MRRVGCRIHLVTTYEKVSEGPFGEIEILLCELK